MKLVNFFAVQLARFWRFNGLFQPLPLRIIHLLVVFFVVLEFILIGLKDVFPSAIHYHKFVGVGLCALAIIMLTYCFILRGVKYFYPYLWGDLTQLKSDMAQSLKFKIVPLRPRGLAATVRGFGLVALVLTLAFGLTTAFLWNGAGGIHGVCASLLMIYLVCHGGMALVRFVTWEKKVFK